MTLRRVQAQPARGRSTGGSFAAGDHRDRSARRPWPFFEGSQRILAFLRIAKTLYPFVLTQFRTQNRFALPLELL